MLKMNPCAFFMGRTIALPIFNNKTSKKMDKNSPCLSSEKIDVTTVEP